VVNNIAIPHQHHASEPGRAETDKRSIRAHCSQARFAIPIDAQGCCSARASLSSHQLCSSVDGHHRLPTTAACRAPCSVAYSAHVVDWLMSTSRVVHDGGRQPGRVGEVHPFSAEPPR
jgi:hypothetical protein